MRTIPATDPRIEALAVMAHSTYDGDAREWRHLDMDERHTWRAQARGWLRVTVALGLLPRVIPSTGKAAGIVSLDVDPITGHPYPTRTPTAAELAATVARIEEWADQLDDARRQAGPLTATDTTADVLRAIIHGVPDTQRDGQ